MGVLSGTACSKVPKSSSGTCNQLTSQIPPVQKWGYTFVTRGTVSGDILRVLVAEDSTEVVLTGTVTAATTVTLAKAKFYDFGTPA